MVLTSSIDGYASMFFDAFVSKSSLPGYAPRPAFQAHNLKVIGSNPIPATKYGADLSVLIKKPPQRSGFLISENRH
jgi:hypothetical protein